MKKFLSKVQLSLQTHQNLLLEQGSIVLNKKLVKPTGKPKKWHATRRKIQVPCKPGRLPSWENFLKNHYSTFEPTKEVEVTFPSHQN
jgi:hypothetical protein